LPRSGCAAVWILRCWSASQASQVRLADPASLAFLAPLARPASRGAMAPRAPGEGQALPVREGQMAPLGRRVPMDRRETQANLGEMAIRERLVLTVLEAVLEEQATWAWKGPQARGAPTASRASMGKPGSPGRPGRTAGMGRRVRLAPTAMKEAREALVPPGLQAMPALEVERGIQDSRVQMELQAHPGNPEPMGPADLMAQKDLLGNLALVALQVLLELQVRMAYPDKMDTVAMSDRTVHQVNLD